ncbi:50S ribosomal protein L23, partial [Mycobacterium tuberculosis]|nr:50S ribosomal protein L23 [Mycobacterium tuberculosis]
MTCYRSFPPQYTFNVESGSTRTEIKHWVELFFDVKVIAMTRKVVPVQCARFTVNRASTSGEPSAE